MSIRQSVEHIARHQAEPARVLRDLIDEGYINQKIGVHDRRKRLLFLTAKGHNCMTASSPRKSAGLNRWRQRWTLPLSTAGKKLCGW